MTENNDNTKSIQDKLAILKYNCSDKGHLVIDPEICKKCREKTCTFICPADVYSVDKDTNELVVSYENCLECGACRIACPKNKINWQYPSAGCGIILKHS